MTVPVSSATGGTILSDALVSSAIIANGEEGGAPASSDGLFDSANDPELALVTIPDRILCQLISSVITK